MECGGLENKNTSKESRN